MAVMMKCGHAANAVETNTGRPCCVICHGDPRADQIEDIPAAIEDRQAQCGLNCGRTIKSSTNLPFFEYRPNKPYDSYYCGCRGWD